MQYKAISADGHVNEPPNLWVEHLPEKFRERGPHVIETPKTKGHAWIMEGQQRPSVMGFSSMYFRSSKRFDRASLVEGFKQIKDRGVRYEDLFPGSYDPAARVHEIVEDKTDAEVIFNGVGTVWNGIKLCADKELALACYKVYNDWIADFQAYAPERFVCNGTLPTTGLQDAMDELHRCADLGLRTVQLESYPSGSFSEPSPEDDRFWAAAVELGMPINVHTQFFFPAGDLGSKISAEGVADRGRRAKRLGLDVQAGSFPVILWRMIQSGVFERFPDLAFVGTEVQTGWVPYYLERFDESVRRNRADWGLPLLPSEYFRRNVSVVYIVDEVGAHNRYDIGVANMMWGPDFPHSSSAWPVDYELGREVLERASCTESEIERIMWKNAADLYKLPYDSPDTLGVAA
ncbi:MAG TPA: amidohydrolase family protein [Acidimicrobiales bacterium]|nr:amidohydrolase family protein [Acidimicrobiales bacterium]